MKYIKLSKGYVTKVDDEDFDSLNKFKWWFGPGGYAVRQVYIGKRNGGKCENIFMHQSIMGVKKGLTVDHINGDKLNNTRENLRFATQSQNSVNRAVVNPSGYRGVQFDKMTKKWRAKITKDYKQYPLGYYETKEEAARAYDKSAIELYGEFAKLNFGYSSESTLWTQ